MARTLQDGGNGGLLDATCFSWISVNAGDQEISVNYTGDDGVTYNAAYDSNAVSNGAIVKEWNRLEYSCVTASYAVACSDGRRFLHHPG